MLVPPTTTFWCPCSSSPPRSSTVPVPSGCGQLQTRPLPAYASATKLLTHITIRTGAGTKKTFSSRRTSESTRSGSHSSGTASSPSKARSTPLPWPGAPHPHAPVPGPVSIYSSSQTQHELLATIAGAEPQQMMAPSRPALPPHPIPLNPSPYARFPHPGN